MATERTSTWPGPTDTALIAKLNEILAWAKENEIQFFATNGVRDVDHGTDSVANRASEDRRTAMLVMYFAERERVDQLKVELVSLNDVFIRHQGRGMIANRGAEIRG
jgi:ABC-type uncharacterized transport system ATPase subunit